jgi:hypothetical protein
MRPTQTLRIIKLEPLEPKLPILARRVQQKLAHLAPRTRLHLAPTNRHTPILPQRHRRDRGNRLGATIPRIRVLINRRGKGGDIELVGWLAPERPGRADVGHGVDEEVELAGGGGVGGDVEGDFGVFL